MVCYWSIMLYVDSLSLGNLFLSSPSCLFSRHLHSTPDYFHFFAFLLSFFSSSLSLLNRVPISSSCCFLCHLTFLNPFSTFIPSLLSFYQPSSSTSSFHHGTLFSSSVSLNFTNAGLSKSFPLDNSLFDSWLAQSVQITADDMLSGWALSSQHQDKSASLLSDQVWTDER